MLTAARSRLVFRVAFVTYVPVLFAGTHWPNLELPADGRPDLMVHLVAFGLWTVLLIGAGFFGPALSWRNIFRAAPVAVVYTALDEASQAVPVLNRHAALDDFAANLLGILLAFAGAAALMKMRGGRSTQRQQQVNTAREHNVPR